MRSLTEPGTFSDAEAAALRAHGVVLFAGRVIFDARPALTKLELHQIQRQCAGPLPEELRALWKQTAGGRLTHLPVGSFSYGHHLGADGLNEQLARLRGFDPGPL